MPSKKLGEGFLYLGDIKIGKVGSINEIDTDMKENESSIVGQFIDSRSCEFTVSDSLINKDLLKVLFFGSNNYRKMHGIPKTRRCKR